MAKLVRCSIYCWRCETKIEDVTEDYLRTYYGNRIRYAWWEGESDEEDEYTLYAYEHWRKCPDCLRESQIVPHYINRKDLRYIATKEERESKRKVDSYKRKKREAKYKEER